MGGKVSAHPDAPGPSTSGQMSQTGTIWRRLGRDVQKPQRDWAWQTENEERSPKMTKITFNVTAERLEDARWNHTGFSAAVFQSSVLCKRTRKSLVLRHTL